MTEIKITVDAGLPERSGRINRQTYLAIKKAKGDSAFFPDGKFFSVGKNPFDPDYVILVADEEMDDGTLVVSRDVKALFYKDLATLSLKIIHGVMLVSCQNRRGMEPMAVCFVR